MLYEVITEGYLQLAREEPHRIQVIAAAGDEDTVFAQLRAALARRLGQET